MCVICQCGADGLAMDEMDSFNLSSRAYTDCIQHVLDLRLPTLLLGGGRITCSLLFSVDMIFQGQDFSPITERDICTAQSRTVRRDKCIDFLCIYSKTVDVICEEI